MKVASRKSCQFGSASGTFFTFRSSFGVLHVHTNFEVGAFAIRRSTRKRPSIDARCSMKRVKAVDLAMDLGIRERCRLTETFARLSEPNTMCKLDGLGQRCKWRVGVDEFE